VIGVGHTGRPNMPELICLRTACVAHSGHHWWPSLMSLDSSRWDLSNNIGCLIVKTLVCLWGLFLFLCFFFLSSCNLWREGGEKKVEKIYKKNPEAHRSSDDDTASTVEKISMRRIQRHQRRSQTVTGMFHTSCPKKNKPRHFRLLVWPTQVTVRDILVVGFVLSISFQRYQWCCYWSFSVYSGSFSFFSCFSFSPLCSLFIVKCVSLFLTLERVTDDTCGS